MLIEDTTLPGVRLLRPRRFADARGFFSETFRLDRAAELLGPVDFVQDNLSFSKHPGTIRGLHFQVPPHGQPKLVSVLRGAVLDVAVDIRHGSTHFGRHVAVRLDAAEGAQIFVPAGFAHGICTLEPDTIVLYKVGAYYAPGHEHGLLWSDPALGIAWPVTPEAAVVSDKDRAQPRLADLPRYFEA